MMLDEYGEERFTCERARATVFECLCGFLLSVTTYVAIEGMFFSFSALEFLLEPLTGDMVFTVNAANTSAFRYIAICFIPCALYVATLKTVLMPLYLAPLYLIFVILLPFLHLLIGYSSCIRILSAMRSGGLSHAMIFRQLMYAFVAECMAWGLIHRFLLPDEPDFFLAEGEGITCTGIAVLALTLSPASAVARFYMEPFPAEATSNAESVSNELQDSPDLSKKKSLIGLFGLIVGGAYARTARLYLESVIVFGAGPSMWKRMVDRSLDTYWIPNIVCMFVPCFAVYYAVRGAMCLVSRLYAAAVISVAENDSRALTSHLLLV